MMSAKFLAFLTPPPLSAFGSDFCTYKSERHGRAEFVRKFLRSSVPVLRNSEVQKTLKIDVTVAVVHYEGLAAASERDSEAAARWNAFRNLNSAFRSGHN